MKRKTVFALVCTLVMSISGLCMAQSGSPLDIQFRIDGEQYRMTEGADNNWSTVFYVDEEEAARNGGLQANIDYLTGAATGSTSWNNCYTVADVSIPEENLTATATDQTQVPFTLSVDDQEAGLYEVTLNIATGALSFTYLSEGVPGDVNVDGKMDIIDAMIIAQAYVGQPVPESVELDFGDVNCDGVADIVDSTIIAQAYTGTQTAIDTIDSCWNL